jgi:hypothetical protein
MYEIFGCFKTRYEDAMLMWLNRLRYPTSLYHKVLTYVKYRAVSGVFQNIVNILEDARHRMGLLQNNLSTVCIQTGFVMSSFGLMDDM